MKAYLAYCQNRRMQVKSAYLGGCMPRASIAKANRGNLEKEVEDRYRLCVQTREKPKTSKEGQSSPS